MQIRRLLDFSADIQGVFITNGQMYAFNNSFAGGIQLKTAGG